MLNADSSTLLPEPLSPEMTFKPGLNFTVCCATSAKSRMKIDCRYVLRCCGVCAAASGAAACADGDKDATCSVTACLDTGARRWACRCPRPRAHRVLCCTSTLQHALLAECNAEGGIAIRNTERTMGIPRAANTRHTFTSSHQIITQAGKPFVCVSERLVWRGWQRLCPTCAWRRWHSLQTSWHRKWRCGTPQTDTATTVNMCSGTLQAERGAFIRSVALLRTLHAAVYTCLSYTDKQGTPNGQRSRALRQAKHIHTSMQTPLNQHVHLSSSSRALRHHNRIG